MLIYWCVSLFHLLLNNTNCDIWYHYFYSHCFKIRIQAFKIRIQAFKIRIQAFKTVADTSRNIGGGGGGGGEIFNMYTFGVRLRYANLSNIVRV